MTLFLLPLGPDPNILAADYAEALRAQTIAAAVARLHKLGEIRLNPADLVVDMLEVVPRYAARDGRVPRRQFAGRSG